MAVYNEEKMHCSVCHRIFDGTASICPNCGYPLIKTLIKWDTMEKCVYIKISSLKVIQSIRKGVIWFRPAAYYRAFYEKGEGVIGDKEEFAVVANADTPMYDPKQNEKMIAFCVYVYNVESNELITIVELEFREI